MTYITQSPIFPEAFFLLRPSLAAGALATFFGIVRNHNKGLAVRRLYYECYIPMANRRIHSIREHAISQWGLEDVCILHRIGSLGIGEIAVVVAVAAAHRAEAFTACEAIVDEIKHTVPIWKKEFYIDGTNGWAICQHSPEEMSL